METVTVKVDELLMTLKELFDAEYERGAREAIQKIVHVAQTERGHTNFKKKLPAGISIGLKKGLARRAPRGAPRELVERVLATEAASVTEIAAAADGEVEKSVSQSGIRLELNRGKRERRYRYRQGKWSLNGN